MDRELKRKFPNLVDLSRKTSEEDEKYNCIAWAFGHTNKIWWPAKAPRVHWPISYKGLTAMQAFQAWLTHDGWEGTLDATFDPKFKKIALYTLYGEPTHAAKLIGDGTWSSKLGLFIDLSHTLADLVGPEYGSVFGIYRKAA